MFDVGVGLANVTRGITRGRARMSMADSARGTGTTGQVGHVRLLTKEANPEMKRDARTLARRVQSFPLSPSPPRFAAAR